MNQPVYMSFEKALLSSLKKIEIAIHNQTYATIQLVSYLHASLFNPTSMGWPELTQDLDYSLGLGGRELEEEVTASGESTEEEVV